MSNDNRTPEGWKLVPIEPTEEMVHASYEYANDSGGLQEPLNCWCTMINAAPEAPATVEAGKDDQQDIRIYTQPPYKVTGQDHSVGYAFLDSKNNRVASLRENIDNLGTAQFIAKACNEYHALKARISELEATPPTDAQSVRDAAMEEAASICDKRSKNAIALLNDEDPSNLLLKHHALEAECCADAIRILKTTAAPAGEDARDAARYRWLRNSSYGQWENPIVVSQSKLSDGTRIGYIGPVIGDYLDASIDAAMKGKP